MWYKKNPVPVGIFIFIASGENFTFEISISPKNNNAKKLFFYYLYEEVEEAYFLSLFLKFQEATAGLKATFFEI